MMMMMMLRGNVLQNWSLGGQGGQRPNRERWQGERQWWWWWWLLRFMMMTMIKRMTMTTIMRMTTTMITMMKIMRRATCKQREADKRKGKSQLRELRAEKLFVIFVSHKLYSDPIEITPGWSEDLSITFFLNYFFHTFHHFYEEPIERNPG